MNFGVADFIEFWSHDRDCQINGQKKLASADKKKSDRGLTHDRAISQGDDLAFLCRECHCFDELPSSGGNITGVTGD